ncbi:MAG: putative Ig domain-containing protein, partial [Deltaproteobacteria bacterium]|nr:putative Ig domain-containing protein [Deltaproteobacteria bacterium]
IKPNGASVLEFIVAGSYIEPQFRINEGAGRRGNNKAAFGPGISPCDPTANLPPQITSAPPITASTGVTYTYQVQAVDPNNDPLTFSLTSAPTGMTINNSGLINWTPADAQTGNFPVTVQVSDGRGGTAQQSFTINVTAPAGVNRPPQITSTPVTSVTLGQTYQYDVTATDPDGDTVLFSLLQSPAGAAIDLFTGLISWAPNSSQIGSQFFTVEAQDGKGGRARQSFAVKVEPSTSPLPAQPSDSDNDGFDKTADCNDSNPNVSPGRDEIPGNGLDDDCNPATPDVLSPGSLACSLVSDKRSYASNSLAQLTATVQNLSADLALVGLEAQFTVSDPGRQGVFTTTLPVNTLAPHAMSKSTIAFSTQTRVPGNYRATVDLRFGPAEVCHAEAAFAILASAAAGNAFTGSITTDPAQIAQGETSTLRYQVNNVGNVDLPAVTLKILVVEVASGAVVQTFTDQTSLNRGQSFSHSKTFNSSGVAAGGYLVILQGEGSASQTIDAAFLSITTAGIGCPVCAGLEVVVDENVTVDFNPVLTGGTPTYLGDPDLKPFFRFDISGPTADTWKAIFDVGAKKLLVKKGATIMALNVPPTTNNQRAPGIKIHSTCSLELEEGGTIELNPRNQPSGDILAQVDGDIVVNGIVSNFDHGTGGFPGHITIASSCGDIITGPMSRIQTIGQGAGGSNINILACGDGNTIPSGDIVIKGLVDASYKAAVVSTINVVSFDGAVTIDGNHLLEIEKGTRRRVTSGVTVRSRHHPLPGTIHLQAKEDLTVVGNTTLEWRHANYGAVAIKTASNSSRGGVIDVRSLGGRIIASDRAFDNANRFNTTATINLLAASDIDLMTTGRPNDVRLPASQDPLDMPVVNVQAERGNNGGGGTNRLRSFSGGVSLGANACVLAGFTAKPATPGVNLLTACHEVVIDADACVDPPPSIIDPVCNPPALDPLFSDCAEFNVIFP